MNDAHFHLLINHFPIIGTIFSALILFSGILMKSNVIKRVAFCMFIITAIIAIPTNKSGEGAEEIVEEINGISHKLIEEHEDAANFGFWSTLIVGAISVVALVMSIKNSGLSSVMSMVVMGFSFFSLYFMWQTGLTGGKIRHTEIYATETSNPTHEDGESHEGHEDIQDQDSLKD